MSITYYKRFRMEIDLDGSLAPPDLPPPFSWVSWQESLVDLHAEVQGDGYPDACTRFEVVVHGPPPTAARLDGAPVPPGARVVVERRSAVPALQCDELRRHDYFARLSIAT